MIVGAGPVGLMLACELRSAGVHPLVLERQPRIRDVPRANGLSGQILELLRCRGLLDRFEAASAGPVHPAPRFPFGEVHLDFSGLDDPPLRGLSLPQPRLERLLEERALELGADIRRGREVVGIDQDTDGVIARVHGPGGEHLVGARYLVGCDGARSGVRDRAGIPFPGTTYPEVNRLGQVATPDGVTVLEDGFLDVPGLGRIRPSFVRTDRGVFGIGAISAEMLLVSTTEPEYLEDEDTPMSLAELGDSIRRVLGFDVPLGAPIRLSRYRSEARQAERYRDGRIMLAGDAAHLFPATGVGLNAGMLDAVNLAWKLSAAVRGRGPADLLDTYHDERHFAGARTMLHTQAQVALRRGQDSAARALRTVFLELFTDEQPLRRVGALISGTDLRYPTACSDRHPLIGAFAPNLVLRTGQGATSVADLMRPARPVLLDLADRQDLRDVAAAWADRVDIRIATTERRPADALLIRPDVHIAWAAPVDEPGDVAVDTLREALGRWFGAPRTAVAEFATP
ncbi:FAD-dependent monooxygenase [Actinoalloteichus hoggarensis]|uniref:FAD-dependent monooxygenase n=1 Tax=Actinoalloteichus hoggarensis TaxID=1470176 RepID=UPI0031836C9F